MHQGKFDAAVEIFERLLQEIEPSHHLYFNVWRNLVKAYQKNEQIDRAIALCQSAIDSNNEVAVLWGTKYMENLVPQSEETEVFESYVKKVNKTPLNSPVSKIESKTLFEFKQYCQEHLLENLKAVERKRIETLYSMFLVGVFALVLNWALIHLVFYTFSIL